MIMSNSNEESFKSFGRSIGLVGIAQAIDRFKGLIIIPILTKNITTGDYGIYSLVLITILFLQPIILLGYDSGMLRFLSLREKRNISQGISTGIVVALTTGIILSLVLFLSSDFLSTTVLKDESIGYAIKLALPLLILTAINTILLGSFRIFGLITWYSIVVIIKTIFELLITSILVLFGYGLYGAIISLIITEFFASIIMIILIAKHAGPAYPNFSSVKPYLLYGLPLVPTSIFLFIVAYSDRYLIEYFLGIDEVGFYSAAYGIGSIILVFSAYIMYVLRPIAYKLFDCKEESKVKNFLSYSWKYIILFSVPSAFGLSLLAKPIILILTTSEFVETGIIVIPLVAFSIIFYGLGDIFGLILLIYRKSGLFSIIIGISAFINLVLNIILIPKLNVLGAAISTLLAYMIYLFIICLWSRKYLKINLMSYNVIKVILASIVMSGFVFIINPTDLLGIIISILIGVIVYFSLLLLMKEFGKNEIKTIGDIIGITPWYSKRKKIK
jgi:O-antigen/teichoic acid export membrane protein